MSPVQPRHLNNNKVRRLDRWIVGYRSKPPCTHQASHHSLSTAVQCSLPPPAVTTVEDLRHRMLQLAVTIISSSSNDYRTPSSLISMLLRHNRLAEAVSVASALMGSDNDNDNDMTTTTTRTRTSTTTSTTTTTRTAAAMVYARQHNTGQDFLAGAKRCWMQDLHATFSDRCRLVQFMHGFLSKWDPACLGSISSGSPAIATATATMTTVPTETAKDDLDGTVAATTTTTRRESFGRRRRRWTRRPSFIAATRTDLESDNDPGLLLSSSSSLFPKTIALDMMVMPKKEHASFQAYFDKVFCIR